MPINDPIAHWRLDDGTGAVAVDSSGNGYDLTLVNAPAWIAPAQIAGGLNFVAAGAQKGETSAAALLASLQGASAYTVALWARAAAYQADAAAFAIHNAGSGLASFILYPYDSAVGANGARFYLHSGFGNVGVDQDAEVALNEWHHFAVVQRSSTDRELFVDNVSAGTTTTSTNLPATISHVVIGGWNGGQFFTGDLDDVRIYNRALSAGELTELFEWRGDVGAAAIAQPVGSGSVRRQPLPWWWHSYFEQWLEELEEREREYRRLKAKKDAEAAEKRKQEALLRIAGLREQRALQDAVEQAERQANAAELRQRVQGARDDKAAEQAALGQRAQDALSRVDARKLQQQAEAEVDELRKLRLIARSPHRRFNQRFEAAITAARRQGWRAK